MVTLDLSVDSQMIGLVLSLEINGKLKSRRCLQCGMQRYSKCKD